MVGREGREVVGIGGGMGRWGDMGFGGRGMGEDERGDGGGDEFCEEKEGGVDKLREEGEGGGEDDLVVEGMGEDRWIWGSV